MHFTEVESELPETINASLRQSHGEVSIFNKEDLLSQREESEKPQKGCRVNARLKNIRRLITTVLHRGLENVDVIKGTG